MVKNKGITLIALVITIIILLILAGISIATLTGENGLLTKANTAKEITKEEGIKEEIKIAYASVETDAIMNGWDINKKAEELQKELRKEDPTAIVTVEGTNLKVSYKGVELIINEKGQIEIAEKGKITINEFSIKGTKVTSITPPEGFVHVGGTIDEGYVISDDPSDANKGVDADLAGNQFVWVPVEQNQKITAKVSSEEKITSLVITDPYGDDIVTKGESDNIGKQYNEQIEPTINGPYRIAVTTESGENKKAFLSVHSLYALDTFRDWAATEEYAKAKGYENLEEMLNGKTVEEYIVHNVDFYKNYSETEDYKAKVNKNGGFYIGRYEAGDASATKERTYSTKEGTLVTKKNQFVYNLISQTDALSKAKAYKTNLNSSLLTGAAWNRTLGWLYETKSKTSNELIGDSKTWGNYSDDTFSNTEELIKTGVFNETKANNIYDLAGNVCEWTSEVYPTDNSVGRGGEGTYKGSTKPASYNYAYYDSSRRNEYNGFRLALYL